MSAPDDEAAVTRVLDGDLSAFAEIVQRWQGPLVSLAYRFVGDRGRAEEMAQEAFVRAYRRLATWRREATFSAWLFALATNLYRSELRRIPVSIPLDTVAEPADPRHTDAEVEASRRRRALHRTLQTLPSRYRDVLVLFYFHEMNVATTARSLGVPEGTVKARLARGRALLRKKLERSLGGPDGTR